MNRPKYVGILSLLLLSVVLLARERTITIGDTQWYTEQNSFQDIVSIAKKENKPILAFFSASWCKPCQHVKKNVFSKKEFKAVENEALLLYIEQTEKKGLQYFKQFDIKGMPAIKIFSSNGTLLETTYPGSKPSDYLKWVRRVKGEQQYHQRLVKNPADWEALFVVTEWQRGDLKSNDRFTPKIKRLRKALEVSKSLGNSDPNRQKAYERLADYLFTNMTSLWSDAKKKEYAQSHTKEFNEIMKIYFPDKYKYTLRFRDPYAMWSQWLYAAGDYHEALKIFTQSPLAKKEQFEYTGNEEFLRSILQTYLALGDEKKAMAFFKKIETAYQNGVKDMSVQFPPTTYMQTLADLIIYYDKNDNSKEKDKYLSLLNDVLKESDYKINPKTMGVHFMNIFKVIEHLGEAKLEMEIKKVAPTIKIMIGKIDDKRKQNSIYNWMAKEYGVYIDEALDNLKIYIKNKNQGLDTVAIMETAVLMDKKGQKDEAFKLIMETYDKLKDKDISNKSKKAKAYNNLAWGTYLIDQVKPVSLEMAKKSLQIERNDYNLDTIAMIYYKLGDLDKAIQYEKEALEKASNDKFRRDFKIMLDQLLKEKASKK